MDDIKKILYHINYPYDSDLGIDDPNRFFTKVAAEAILTEKDVYYRYRYVDNGNISNNRTNSDTLSATDKYIILDEDDTVQGLTLYLPYNDTNTDTDNKEPASNYSSPETSGPDSSTTTAPANNTPTTENVTKSQTSLDLLHPVTKQAVVKVITEMKNQGFNPRIMETYRSTARQEHLNKGPNTQVNFGYHNFVNSKGKPAAQAVDIAIQLPRGATIDEIYPPNLDHPFWVALGRAYLNNGMEWGGNWRNPDAPHGEMKKKPGLNFRGDGYNTLYKNSDDALTVATKLGSVASIPGEVTVSAKYRMFVTWGFIEDYLLAYINTPINSRIYNESEARVESNQILNFTELRSCDLDVCMLPGQEFMPQTQTVDIAGASTPVIKNSSKNYVNKEHNIYPYQRVLSPETSAAGPPEPIDYKFADFTVPGNPKRGYLRNIAVNVSYIERIYNSLGNNPRLNDFINRLLSGINESCGNLWEFSMAGKPYDQTGLAVYDTNCINADIIDLIKSKNALLDFTIKRPFLKSLNMTTNLSDRLASAAYASSLGASYSTELKDGSFFTLYGHNNDQIIVDKLRNKIPPTTTNATPDLITIDQSNEAAGEINPVLEYFNDVYIYINSGHKKGAAKSSLVNLVNKFKNSTDGLDFKPLASLQLSIVTPGITGIYMGNSFTVEGINEGGWLPDRYKANTLFQCNEVSHTIDTTKWETNISTLLRHKPAVRIKYIEDANFFADYINDVDLDFDLRSGKNTTAQAPMAPRRRNRLKQLMDLRTNGQAAGVGSAVAAGASVVGLLYKIYKRTPKPSGKVQ